jgi:phosphoglycolate phosphatase-like HAD superfamily hydrolase
MRLVFRQEKTLSSAAPIVEITQYLEEMRKKYQLIIVSATSEQYIIPVLRRYKLDVFSYIFGKDLNHRWVDAEGKTPAFIRASTMTGIPLSRMCFIGDSDADFRAARQLGLKFIENRINANKYNLPSLIDSREPSDEEIFIDRSSGNDLRSVIDRVRETFDSI